MSRKETCNFIHSFCTGAISWNTFFKKKSDLLMMQWKNHTKVSKTNDWFIFLQQWCKYQPVLQSKKCLPGQGYNRETPWAFLKILCHRTIEYVQPPNQDDSKYFLRNMTLCPESQKDFLIFWASDCTPNSIHYFPEMTSRPSPIAPTWIFMKSSTEN